MQLELICSRIGIKAQGGIAPFLSNIGSSVGNFFTGGGDKALNALKVGGAGAVITGLLAEREQQEGESDIDYANRRANVNDQLKVQFQDYIPRRE